ncbi:MAG: hypothetical protein IM445_17690 [Microcystis sp. M015S1]|jgi:hypothetical protein|uniref:hypothetical protein n=1 Tax=Microcystis sp. M017S1 TaxID=2771107 RepID=UPI002587A263|nr:hypothetical protein [Microcystis sp. M017S1]MCA2917298.1 hypothetical protein [Microcystis sp. M017S1]MCA2936484.1 hypothetical protein [Microcystis sp. M015S1]MCA3161159.1 hypothetical protein [Burkholderiales bacterium]MCA3173298.1 hypothetical protein [Burkholderiales bacterium]
MSHQPGIERNGAVVEIGDQVRLLSIRPSILERLVGAEHSDVSAMLGQVVEVFDVYESGQVWVSALFPRKDGTTEVHAISVDPQSIELVQKARNG